MPLIPSTERPRIACLITNSETGGAQSHVADLLRALRGQADVTLLAGGDGPLFDLARDLGIPAIRLAELDNALSPFKAVAALGELRRALREARPDILHTHSAKASALGRIAGKLLGIPVVYTVHGFAFKPAAPWKQRTIARLAEWLLAPLTSHVICVAEAERAMARQLPIRADRISVIPNGIADVAERAQPGDALRRVVTVMRLAPPKRPDVLIQAFAAAQLPNCELVIAGDGPQRASLERLAGPLAPGRVRFAGSIDDIPAVLASAQLFLLASDHEGFPISILEAMRAGLPVIASDLPGIREQLGEGRCGVLVSDNYPAAFADALHQVAADAAARAAAGAAGRLRWEQAYGLEPMVRATWTVYQQVLAGNRQPDTRAQAS
ncbi:Glycosyltransferase involved in cell wall bisynthesis [Ralstonia sp. 25mfcol4.1]|uniref:glycosyltransferase family 4 protein n=1 Tax=Ralstonia sp. 25mfcol4.1 TaxID=1761899 RepID=UPI00048F385A|nr:glycosyltransferase family 4 protein [Ralstonia sp. 25mfcol4.1]SDP56978.1 Glycosyltransferase involved in cell wall bisynthesis [Ralstonia sp. 25mfcol4.1]